MSDMFSFLRISMAVSFTLMQYIHEARLRITTDDHELAGCQTKNDERKQLSTQR